MKHKIMLIILYSFAAFSCEFRKSVNKDLITGLTTMGDGLSSDKVYLSDGENRVNRNVFRYGEKFYLNFENIEGFKSEEGNTFPGMQLLVISQTGDTALQNNDLYASYENGINIEPLVLQANLTAARPILSDNHYALHVKIWDKKGQGIFTAKMDFDVVANDLIKIEKNNIAYQEIYLFSKERKVVIPDNRMGFDENVYVIFEGLKGFQEESGNVFPGLSIKATDAEGNLILNEGDLFGETPMEISEFVFQVAPSFIFTATDIKNPVTCEVAIWDKKSDSSIKASVVLNIE